MSTYCACYNLFTYLSSLSEPIVAANSFNLLLTFLNFFPKRYSNSDCFFFFCTHATCNSLLCLLILNSFWRDYTSLSSISESHFPLCFRKCVHVPHIAFLPSLPTITLPHMIGKVIPLHAMEAHGVRGGISPAHS
jgi:hypothetical protein